ncbi:unnamed protein product [Candidula unifasciata]|uniref:Protein with SprT-like domain at the N terminus n=1 Tax=Candidula unifasciata TaxID=100452 RepID=A0A8S4A619_9EUPU|nr:unnamed protein product [Candidula unifasciata]
MFTSNNLDDSYLAKLLQEEYDREAAVVLDDEDQDDSRNSSNTESSFVSSYDKRKPVVPPREAFMQELSPVDPSLELSDPTPDIILLFLDFNERYFWGSLAGIEVKWSPRMTLCAGLCVYEGRGGLCSVRLSLPLLKLRPRKDLVETLLHEMIHAYLFVTNNDRDHSGHGPNFLSHMKRLNKATGANISVYHTFNDEVDSYQQHWWRCSGPCQRRAPYFGYVKRSMNRAPSAKDFWWPEHQATCGGVYTKVKEPEGYGQKKPGKGKGKEGAGNAVEPSKDIRTFWGNGHILSSNTEAINKAAGASPSQRKSGTHFMNTATFSSGAGPSNATTGQRSVNGALSNPSYNHRNKSAVTDPLSRDRSEIFPSVSFKQAADRDHPDKYSASTVITANRKTSVNSNSTVSDIRKELSDNSSSQPVKRNTSANNNNTSSETRVGKTNSRSDFHKHFDNSFSINKKQKNSPHLNNKKVVFPKNFVSVCVGGDSSSPIISVKRKKKKYVMDELDSNDGLWDETADLTADLKRGQLSNELNSTGKIGKLDSNNRAEERGKLPAGLTNHRGNGSILQKMNSPKSKPFQASAQSLVKTDVKTGEIKNGNGAEKRKNDDVSRSGTRLEIDNFHSRASVSERGAAGFSGEGFKLGTGESGSSFLSQIRKTWQEKSYSAASASSREPSHSSPGSRLSQLSHIDQMNAGSSLLNKKRTSMEAFGARVNNLDSYKTVKVDKEISRHNHSSIQNTSVSESPNEVIHIDVSHTLVKVPCPVCSISVPENTINAHLDLCLLAC